MLLQLFVCLFVHLWSSDVDHDFGWQSINCLRYSDCSYACQCQCQWDLAHWPASSHTRPYPTWSMAGRHIHPLPVLPWQKTTEKQNPKTKDRFFPQPVLLHICVVAARTVPWTFSMVTSPSRPGTRPFAQWRIWTSPPDYLLDPTPRSRSRY